MLCSATAPVGYSTNSADCNDNDANIHAPISYYIDNDKDGYGSTVTAMLCSLTAPIGYSTNNTDCDDTDPTLNPATIPVINGLPLNINVSNNAGVCGATVSWTAPTTLVNCTGSSISQTAGPANGSQFPIGTTIVTYTVTDAALHTVNASFSVTVNDTEVPLAIAKNVTIYVDAYGTASVSPNTVNNGSTDNCSVLSVSLSKLNFTCADVGENVVTLTVNDIHGNSANVTATVTVKDNILPVAKCRNVEVYLDQNNTATITPGQVDNVSTDNCSIKTLVLSQTQFTAAGTYPVELTVTDVNGNIAKCNSTVTIKKRSVTLTYTGDNTEQYSDQQTLSATLKDDGSGNGVSGKTISFTIGSQTVTAVTNASGVASTTLTLTQNPDAAYTVATSFAGDGNYLAGADNDAFTIIDEDARVNYIGLMFQATPNVSTSTATVVLQASVIDIAAAVGDAAYDAFAGDIRNARVRFINRDNNTYLSGWLTPALVNNADLKVGTVSASYTFNIGTADAAQFTIGIEVGTPDGYYVRKSSDDNTVLTVYKPLGEFVTGGGYIIPTQSSGSYAATAGLKTNFGMNVKNNKTGTNLKGSVNIIFRRNVASVIRTYQIKANAMTSLGVGGTSANRKAQFLSKANLTDVTDPLNNISLGGNLDLRVDMTDKGEPGNTDSISVTLFNSSGTLLYSSNWIVSKTVQKVLSAGNININSASISPATVKAPDTKLAASTMEHAPSIFDVKVMNNPTMTSFRLKLESNDINTKFTLKVIDVVGRIIEIKEQLYAGQVIELGGGYFKGSYFAEVTQGRQRKVIKLIKMTSH